jgi:hypothetical protein
VIARLDRNLGWLVMAEPRFAIETDLSVLDLPLDPGLFEAPRGVQIVRVQGGELATLLEGMAAAGQIGLRR